MLPKRFTIISNWNCKIRLATIVDVGTDHGKLARYLARKYQNSIIIGLDLRAHIIEKQQAKSNNKRFNNLHFQQSDGLKAVKQPVDLAIIAGLGEQTILKILNTSKRAKYYIFQLRNEPIAIRKWCQKSNYRYLKDTIIFDGKHYYHTLFVSKEEGKQFDSLNLLFGDYQHRSKEFNRYWKEKKTKLEKIVGDMPKPKQGAFYQSKIVPIKNIMSK